VIQPELQQASASSKRLTTRAQAAGVLQRLNTKQARELTAPDKTRKAAVRAFFDVGDPMGRPPPLPSPQLT
jgi:hypothetical protein